MPEEHRFRSGAAAHPDGETGEAAFAGSILAEAGESVALSCLSSPGGGGSVRMQCEPRWGDGLSPPKRASVDSLSPRPVSHSLREREPTRPLKGRVGTTAET